MLKIFHDPCKNSPTAPATYLMCGPLRPIKLSECKGRQDNARQVKKSRDRASYQK